MKTSKLLPALTAIMITIGIFASCKKDNEEIKPTCRIITIAPNTGDAFNITYNSEGKIASIVSGDNVTTFAYSGNTAIATTNDAGVFSSRKIITINANGLASNVKTESNASGTNWDNQAFDYSGTELIKATSTSSGGGSPSISTLTWANGNLVSLTTGSSVTTIDYFTDKPAQTGDYLDIAQLVQGYRIYKTKNMIKSLLSGSSINSFDYSFGANGQITSLAVTGASASIFTYQHQCN